MTRSVRLSRPWIVIAAVAAALLGAAPADAALSGYTFESLNGCCNISGSATKVFDAAIGPAINNLGDVVVQTLGSHTGYVLKDGVWYPFTFKAATPTSNTFAIPFDINDSDVVVGTTTDGGPGGIGGVGGSEEAAAWTPVSGSQAPIVLGQVDGSDPNCDGGASFSRECSAFATNINDAGQIAGYGEFYVGAPPPYFTLVPFRHFGIAAGSLSSGDVIAGPTPGTSYETSGINANGQVVVSPNPATPTDGNSSAIEPGGQAIPFSSSHGALIYHSINNTGEVIGNDATSGHAKLWNGTSVVDLPPLPGEVSSSARGINNAGDVVGTSGDAAGCPRAVLWLHTSYSTPIDLNSLVGPGDTLLHANGINDYGQIVGQGGNCVDGSGYQDNINPWVLTPPFNGTVVDTKGQPIAGAVVKVTGTDSTNTPVSMSATTAADGTYDLRLQPGTYDFDVTGTQPPKQPTGGVWHTDSCPGTVTSGGKCHVVLAASSPGGANFRYALPDIQAENVEITQGIQSDEWDHLATVSVPGFGATPGGTYAGVPLVKDVATVVRVYASVVRDADVTPQDATVELHGYSGAGGGLSELAGSPLTAPARSLKVNFSLPGARTDPEGASTFTLPRSWTEHGPLTLVADVNPKVAGGEREIHECLNCDDNNAYALSQVGFKTTKPVTIRPIEITYNYPNASGHGTTHVVPPDLASHFARANQILPLAPGDLVVQPFPQAVVDISADVKKLVTFFRSHGVALSKPSLSDCERLAGCANDLTSFEFSAIHRFVTLSHSSATRTFLVAYEPGTAGATWPTKGLTILGLDNPARPLTSTTHELMHLLGFEHASTACGGGSGGQIGVTWPPDQLGYIEGVGLDRAPNSGGPGQYRIIAPGVGGQAQYYDLMSYCTIGHGFDASAWLSTVNWTKFVQDGGVTGTVKDSPPLASTASAGSNLEVDASLTPGGQAELLGAVGASTPATRSVASSPFKLQETNARGKVVASVGVAPERLTETPVLMFSAVLPAKNAAGLSLVAAGRTIAKLKRPSPAPKVKLVIPRRGLKVARHALTITWKQSGARGVTLVATVQIETSAATGWQTIITGLTSRRETITIKQFRGARKAQVRVLVNDGFSTAIATSPKLKLPAS